MTFQDIVDILITSARSDWMPINCSYGKSSYHDIFSFWEKYDEQLNVLKCDQHTGYAVYEKDISLSIAFGLTITEDWTDSWTQVFPDKKASFNLVDVFYNGALVYRSNYVSVDGGRCSLPLPISSENLQVHQLQFNLVRLINELEGQDNFEDYFSRAGFSRTK